MKKYELLPKESNGLRRVRALRNFGNVKAGDLGGYVQSENNLSHGGLCWVFDDAQVYGDAWVFDDAQVFDDARVYGSAQVFGNARVSGNAWVHDDTWVRGNARVHDDACRGAIE